MKISQIQKGNTEQIFVKTVIKARDKIWYDVKNTTISERRQFILKEALWQQLLDDTTVILAEENITNRHEKMRKYERKLFPGGASALFTEQDPADVNFDIDEALEEWINELWDMKGVDPRI